MAQSKNNNDNNYSYLLGLISRSIEYAEKMAEQDKQPEIIDLIKKESEASRLAYKDTGKLIASEIHKNLANYADKIRSMGLGTKEFTRLVKDLEDIIKEVSEKRNVSLDAMNAIKSNFTLYAGKESYKDKDNPVFNFASKKAQGNPDVITLKKVLESSVVVKLDSMTDRIINAINGIQQANQSSQKKNQRTFIEDLISGLENSTLFKNTLLDTFKLLSYLAMNWLRQFGPGGKAIGIALIAFAPILAAAMGKVIIKAISSIVGGILAPLALGAGAVGLGMAAKNTWEEGGKRNKAAATGFGLGAAGLGVAAIAALFLPITGSVVAIAAEVGIIAAGIGAIIKYWPQIADFGKKILEILGIMSKKDEDGKYTDSTPGWGEQNFGRSDVRSGIGRDPLWKLDLKGWEEANKERIMIDPITGAVQNFSRMTKQQGAKEMHRYAKEKPEMFNELYEYIKWEEGIGQKGSFKTDLSDEGGFFAPKGTRERVLKAREVAKRMGIDPSIFITSGIGSAGDYETKTSTPHTGGKEGKGHFSPIGAKIDLSIPTIQGKPLSVEETKKFYKSIGLEGAYEAVGGPHFDVTSVSGDLRNYAAAKREEAKASKEGLDYVKSVRAELVGKDFNVDNRDIEKYEKEQEKKLREDEKKFMSKPEDKPKSSPNDKTQPNKVSEAYDFSGNSIAQAIQLPNTLQQVSLISIFGTAM